MSRGSTWDPRSHRRYRDAAARWIASLNTQPVTCVICGRPVDVRLPRTSPHGPTVEHDPPVRAILAIARSRAEAVAMVASPTTWKGVAHRRCQSRQGQAVTASINRARNAATATLATALGASRDW